VWPNYTDNLILWSVNGKFEKFQIILHMSISITCTFRIRSKTTKTSPYQLKVNKLWCLEDKQVSIGWLHIRQTCLNFCCLIDFLQPVVRSRVQGQVFYTLVWSIPNALSLYAPLGLSLWEQVVSKGRKKLRQKIGVVNNKVKILEM